MVGGGRNNAGGEPSAEVLPHRAPALRPREDRGPSCQVEGVEEEKNERNRISGATLFNCDLFTQL